MVQFKCKEKEKKWKKACTWRKSMYDKDRFCQLGLEDFNQPLGLKMNPENRWVKKAAMIPWKEIEEKYSRIFKSTTGHGGKKCKGLIRVIIDTEATGIFRQRTDRRDKRKRKRSYGHGSIVTRLSETVESSIALSIIAMNIGRLVRFYCLKNRSGLSNSETGSWGH